MAKKTLDILIFVTFLVSCIYGNYFLGTFIDLLAICRGIQVLISERNTFSLQWVKYFLFLPLIFGIKVVLIFLKLTAGANNRRTFFILIPLFGVIVAPIMEEYLFRYIPYQIRLSMEQNEMMQKGARVVYYILAVLFFAFFHKLNPIGMLIHIPYGLLAAYSYEKTNTIKLPIMLHSTINLVGEILK